MLIRSDINDRALLLALKQAPEHMQPILDRGIGRAGEEVAREARQRAPKAFSLLVNSIRSNRPRPLLREVGAHVDYDAAVQEGTGPAAGKRRYFPDPKRLETYIALRGGVRLARRGSKKRARQEDEIRYRAGALARFISIHGTRPQPYLASTMQAMAPRVEQLFRHAAAEGLRTLPEPRS